MENIGNVWKFLKLNNRSRDMAGDSLELHENGKKWYFCIDVTIDRDNFILNQTRKRSGSGYWINIYKRFIHLDTFHFQNVDIDSVKNKYCFNILAFYLLFLHVFPWKSWSIFPFWAPQSQNTVVKNLNFHKKIFFAIFIFHLSFWSILEFIILFKTFQFVTKFNKEKVIFLE